MLIRESLDENLSAKTVLEDTRRKLEESVSKFTAVSNSLDSNKSSMTSFQSQVNKLEQALQNEKNTDQVLKQFNGVAARSSPDVKKLFDSIASIATMAEEARNTADEAQDAIRKLRDQNRVKEEAFTNRGNRKASNGPGKIFSANFPVNSDDVSGPIRMQPKFDIVSELLVIESQSAKNGGPSALNLRKFSGKDYALWWRDMKLCDVKMEKLDSESSSQWQWRLDWAFLRDEDRRQFNSKEIHSQIEAECKSMRLFAFTKGVDEPIELEPVPEPNPADGLGGQDDNTK
jgi:hypothetical protein